MKYNIIVAHDLDNGIGKNNNLPWDFVEDLRRFSKLTRGNGNNAIIMGKNTWKSLPRKPLPKRDNLILSTSVQLNVNNQKNECVKTFTNIKMIDEFCEKQNYDEVWIIGGSQIYEQFINHHKVKQIYVTLIHETYDCDTKFPNISYSWKILKSEFVSIRDKTLQYILYEKQ